MKVTDIGDFLDDISDIFEVFSEETQRGVAIIGGEVISEILKDLITNKLVECNKRKDDLFEDAYAPLNSFSSRINFGFRLGVITERCQMTLNKIRKIRNRCSHDFITIDFEDQSLTDDVKDMIRYIYDLIPEMIFRIVLDEEYAKQIAKMKDSDCETQVVNKLIDDFSVIEMYKLICAFIYAYLNDKRNKITRITADDQNSLI